MIVPERKNLKGISESIILFRLIVDFSLSHQTLLTKKSQQHFAGSLIEEISHSTL